MKMILLRPPFSPEAKASSKDSSHAMERDRNGNARRMPTRKKVPVRTPVPERAARLQTTQKKSNRRAPTRRDAVQQRIVWSDDDNDEEEVDAGHEDSHRDSHKDSHKDSHRDSQKVSQRLRAAKSAISRQNTSNSTDHTWAPSGSKPDNWSPSGSAASRLNRALARIDSFPEPEPPYRKGSMRRTNDSIPQRKLPQWQLEERQELWDWMRARNLIAAPDASSYATPLLHYEHLYAPAKNCKLFHALLKVGITSVTQLRAANLWNLVNAGAITNVRLRRVMTDIFMRMSFAKTCLLDGKKCRTYMIIAPYDHQNRTPVCVQRTTRAVLYKHSSSTQRQLLRRYDDPRRSMSQDLMRERRLLHDAAAIRSQKVDLSTRVIGSNGRVR